MAFVAGSAFLVDQSAPPDWDPRPSPTDLRVTPEGGFQVVWNGLPATGPLEKSYRIFDAAGQPLTEEIADGSFSGGSPLQQSIQLDDRTILRVQTELNTSTPGMRLVLQLYHASGVPLGEPIFTTTTFIGWAGAGLAQLPNRDIVFVAAAYTKVGEAFLFSWVLDNTSPDLYAPVLTHIAGADGAAQVPADGAIVVSFNELIELAPSARIDLKTADGVLVDSFDLSDGADLSAWVSTLTITPSVALDPGTSYVLEFAPGSVLDPSGNAFAGGGFDFTTAGEAPSPPSGDTSAPSVIDFYPGAAPLPVDWSPGITFDEEVQAGTGTIKLETAAGQLVQTFSAGDTGLKFLGASVLIDPAADLQPGTSYRLVVGAGAFEDLAGNDAGSTSFSFTTAGTPPPAGDTTAPVATDFYPFPGSGRLLPTDWSPGMTFSEDVEAGAGTIRLETAAGQVVQTFAAGDPAIHFFGASVLIDPAADLQPGTSYRLVAEAGAFEDLAGNDAGVISFAFTTTGTPPPPPPPGGDSTAPTAIDFFPAAGSHMLPPDWSPAITFSEEVRAGAGTITLQTAAGEVVQTFGAGDPGIRFVGASVIIDPAADLLPGTAYLLTVGAGAVQDLAGNAYAGVSDYGFTTAGEPPSTGDTTAPVAIDFFPAPGSSMLPADWNLGITFSETVQAGSGTITLQTAAGEVVQTFSATDAGIRIIDTRVLIDPAADLLPGTTYRLIVGPGAVQDLAGNAYAGVSDYSFTTAGSAPPPPPAGPVLVYSYPDNGKIMFTHSPGLVFNEPVKLGSGVITLETTAGEVVQAAPSFGPGFSSGTRLLIDPTADLQIGTSYRLVIGPGAVVDLDGNPYPGTTSQPFTAATTSAIHVVSMDPAPRSTLPPDGNLSITFDGPVKAGSGGLTLVSTQGSFHETFVTATDSGVQFIGSTLVIDPAVDLQPGTEYHVGFGMDAVEDLAGNFVGVPDFFFSTALVGVPTA